MIDPPTNDQQHKRSKTFFSDTAAENFQQNKNGVVHNPRGRCEPDEASTSADFKALKSAGPRGLCTTERNRSGV